MKNEKLKNKHIEEVAVHLAQRTKFSKEEIERDLYKYEMDIDDITLENIKIYGDVVIFGGVNTEYDGINIRTQQYLNDYECYNIINPDFLVI